MAVTAGLTCHGEQGEARGAFPLLGMKFQRLPVGGASVPFRMRRPLSCRTGPPPLTILDVCRC